MKSLNKYLLTHYPLLWNLRVHWVWPVIIVLHVLFFVTGYASVSLPESLTSYALRPQAGTVSLVVLLAILIGVLWLVYFFRNNAFKSFYPLKKGRLIAEFALIALTTLGLTTFTASYQGGVYSHMRSLTANTDLRRETDIINLSHHFIAFSREEFASSRDCERRGTDRRHTSDVDEHEVYSDTLATQPVASGGMIAAQSAVDTFSYLHYCGYAVYENAGDGTRGEKGNDSIAKRWLYAGQRDSVRMLLTQFIAICKKYSVAHRFDPVKMSEAPFATPGFLIEQEVSTSPYISEEYRADGQYTSIPAEVFVENHKLTEALHAISEARNGWLDMETALFFLYFSLCISLLIFSFRITQLRPWFIAVIGANIWAAVFGVLAALVRAEFGIILIFLSLTVVFLGIAVYLINRRDSKRPAGVIMLWALWAFPAFIPLVAAYIQHLTRNEYRYDSGSLTNQVSTNAPVYDWIRDNWMLINSANFFLVIVLIAFLFIPLARKWQAMPEE